MERPAASKRVGIRDVAKAAGVSRTTASDALTGNGRVGERTRQLVAETALRLGYRANPHARMLRRGRTGILAVASSMDQAGDLSGAEYFTDVVASAATTALSHGYAIVLLPLNPALEQLDQFGASGAIILDPVLGDPMMERFEAAGVPVVSTGRPPDRPADASTWVDNEISAAVRGALELLAARGARRVALLTNEPIRSYTVDTIDAYEAWCADRGLQPEIVSTGDRASESTAYAAAKVLLAGGDPPDALYAPLDRLALGALLAARSAGLRVPEDLMIAAGSDSPGTRSADPPITALQLDPRRIGQTAAELL
ncbi:MAG TPA: LacI family DNA-binding transcriptional regulator, partial [Capillimicrobium sp.]